jgi:hypothetical protein
VQEFGAGGYEATVREVDVEKAEAWAKRQADSKVGDGVVRKRRRNVGDLTSEDKARSVKRARRRVRLLCKHIGANRLLTFTSRELLGSAEEALKAWRKFVRLYRRSSDQAWEYVAVLERHESGYYHLHVAIAGWFHLKQAHRLWQIALGGRGNERGSAALGTIDLDKRKRGNDPAHKIAKYISKYMTKAVEGSAINKKRYWASRADLPALRRMWLSADTYNQAVAEAWKLLQVNPAACAKHGALLLAEFGSAHGQFPVCWWYWSPDWGSDALAVPF